MGFRNLQEKLEKDFYLEVHFLVKSACKKINQTLSPKLISRPVYCLGLCGTLKLGSIFQRNNFLNKTLLYSLVNTNKLNDAHMSKKV